MDRVAIGAVFRRETRYLREWLEFHELVGVDRFYLFNHDCPGPDRKRSGRVLRPYVEQGWVKEYPFDVVKDFQLTAYTYAIQAAVEEGFTWIALIDLDEFLFPTRNGLKLHEALAEFKRDDLAGVVAPCLTFGNSGVNCPPMLQTEAFVCRAPDEHQANSYYKYILRPERVTHYMMPKPGFHVIDQNGVAQSKGKRLTPHHKLRINHYATRSNGDWQLRINRGIPHEGFPIAAHDLPNFYENRWGLFNHNELKDCLIHRYLPELKERLDIES